MLVVQAIKLSLEENFNVYVTSQKMWTWSYEKVILRIPLPTIFSVSDILEKTL